MSYLARLREEGLAEVAAARSDPLSCRLEELRGWTDPPEGLSAARWGVHLDEAAQRVAKWGAPAQALGWTVEELVGLNRTAWMRLDQRGAFFLHTTVPVVGVTTTSMAFRVGGIVMQLRKRT